MKIAALISRLLLGVVFGIFGLNGFFQFMPQGPMPTGLAGQFMAVFMASHYVMFVSGVQVACGILFFANRFVPLALVVIAGVIANILTFHLLMAPGSIGPGIVVTILWFILAYSVRSSFRGILQKTPEAVSASRG